MQKVCQKLAISSVGKIVAESDGAEVEDVEELMTGDRLIVYSTESAQLSSPAAASGSGATAHGESSEHDETIATAEEAGGAWSQLQLQVHNLASELKRRNAAADVGACLTLIQKLAANAEKDDAKFRSIRLTIPKIASTVSRHPAAIEILRVLGLRPQTTALDSDAPGPVDAARLDELGLQHEFLVLPRGSSLRLGQQELQDVLSPHLRWAESRTSSVSGSAGYAAVKSQLAQVRRQYGKDDISQVPVAERYKLYPVYMAAEAAFERKRAAATPVPRAPEVSRDPHTRGTVTAGESAGGEVEDASPSTGGAAAGGEFTEDDIVAELGGADKLAGAQALLAAAGGATSKSMAQYVHRCVLSAACAVSSCLCVCRAKKAAAKLSRLGKYEKQGSRLRLVFMDMTTIIARFSPYECVDAVKDFVFECLDDSAEVARDAILLFKYTASLDKSRDVLTPAAASAVILTGEIPPALSECGAEDTLGLVGLAPAGTVVVVWPSAPVSQPARQGQFLKPDLQSQLKPESGQQVRGGDEPLSTQSQPSTAPPSAGSCCSVS